MQDIIDEHEPDEPIMPSDLGIISDGEFFGVDYDNVPSSLGGGDVIPCEVTDSDGNVVEYYEVPKGGSGNVAPVVVMEYLTENLDFDVDGYVSVDYLGEYWEELFPEADVYSWSYE